MLLVSKENFAKWLIKEDYKEWSGNGYPSTVPQYVYSIEKVMEKENIKTWSELTEHILDLIFKYGKYGPLKNYGEQGHSTIINALERFMDFLINVYDFVPKLGVWYLH